MNIEIRRFPKEKKLTLMLGNVVAIAFKNVFTQKYIKIVYIFYFFKIIFLYQCIKMI
jgi:hypothetical protein